MIEYHLKRSTKRKRIAIEVKQGKVLVKAPFFVETTYIEQLLSNKRHWLESTIALQREKQIESNCIQDNGQLWFLGQLYSIKFEFKKENYVVVDPNQKIITLSLRQHWQFKDLDLINKKAKFEFESFYKAKAEKLIEEKVSHFSQLMNLFPKGLKVRQYKARWGSCNNKRFLQFNYLIAMLPDDVIDYIVIHELAHLQHFNHSREFWFLVAKYNPQYQDIKRWLKEHQHCFMWS